MTQNTEALERIDQFVKGLERTAREIAKAQVSIPNTPDCMPEVIGLMTRYGKAYTEVVDGIENLRQEVGCSNYDWLQYQLQTRL